jgi:hypothetical protein
LLLPRSELVGNLTYLLFKVCSQALQFAVESTLIESVMQWLLLLGLLLELELDLIDLIFEFF